MDNFRLSKLSNASSLNELNIYCLDFIFTLLMLGLGYLKGKKVIKVPFYRLDRAQKQKYKFCGYQNDHKLLFIKLFFFRVFSSEVSAALSWQKKLV